MASDDNSTIIFPLPIELLMPFLQDGRLAASPAAGTNGHPEDESLEMKDPAQAETGAVVAQPRATVPATGG